MEHRRGQVDLGLERHFIDRPFVWHDNDCCSAPANVLADMGDTRLRRRLDAAYRDKASALAWIEAAGGLVALAHGLADELGFAATDAPGPGALGVIAATHGPALALYDGHRFWAKALRGVVMAGEALHTWE